MKMLEYKIKIFDEKSQKSSMSLIGTMRQFKLMCAPNKVNVIIYLQNIDFKESKTAIYVFSNMLNITKFGKKHPEKNLKGLTSDVINGLQLHLFYN